MHKATITGTVTRINKDEIVIFEPDSKQHIIISSRDKFPSNLTLDTQIKVTGNFTSRSTPPPYGYTVPLLALDTLELLPSTTSS